MIWMKKRMISSGFHSDLQTKVSFQGNVNKFPAYENSLGRCFQRSSVYLSIWQIDVDCVHLKTVYGRSVKFGSHQGFGKI